MTTMCASLKGPRKREHSSLEVPLRASPRKKSRLATPNAIHSDNLNQLHTPRSSARIRAKSLSPVKRRLPTTSSRLKREKKAVNHRPLIRSQAIDTISDHTSSTSSSEIEHTRAFVEQFEEICTHQELLDLLSNPRSEPIMRKPMWRLPAQSAAYIIRGKGPATELLPRTVDTARIFEQVVGEFSLSEIRSEDVPLRTPSISELKLHARHCNWGPESLQLMTLEPSDLSPPVPPRRKRKHVAISSNTSVPICTQWAKGDCVIPMAILPASVSRQIQSQPSSEHDVRSLKKGSSGPRNSDTTAGNLSDSGFISLEPSLPNWWEGIKWCFSGWRLLPSNSKKT